VVSCPSKHPLDRGVDKEGHLLPIVIESKQDALRHSIENNLLSLEEVIVSFRQLLDGCIFLLCLLNCYHDENDVEENELGIGPEPQDGGVRRVLFDIVDQGEGAAHSEK
jgi:hypothetical protein